MRAALRRPFFRQGEDGMTGNDIFNTALALLGEPSSSQSDYDSEVVIRLLNTALVLAYRYNQQLREYRGREKMAEIPAISSLADGIDYEEEFVRNVLPYRLASDLAFADEETQKAEYYNQMFQTTMLDFTTPIAGPVADVYGGAADEV